MPYLALKPGKFCDKQYLIGDLIPEDAVDPGITRVLEDAGAIQFVPARSARRTSDDHEKDVKSDGGEDAPAESATEASSEQPKGAPPDDAKPPDPTPDDRPRGKKAG